VRAESAQSYDWVRHPINDAIAAAHNAFVATPARHACHPAWPDTPVFNERGIPAVTYGPGSKHCYWDDEYVPTGEYLTPSRCTPPRPRTGSISRVRDHFGMQRAKKQ
jgi:hypothetical protein